MFTERLASSFLFFFLFFIYFACDETESSDEEERETCSNQSSSSPIVGADSIACRRRSSPITAPSSSADDGVPERFQIASVPPSSSCGLWSAVPFSPENGFGHFEAQAEETEEPEGSGDQNQEEWAEVLEISTSIPENASHEDQSLEVTQEAEKSTLPDAGKSTLPDTEEEEVPEIEVQRNTIVHDEIDAIQIPMDNVEKFDMDMADETSVETVKLDEEDVEAAKEADSLQLQCFTRPAQINQVSNFNCSNTEFTLPDELPEPWANKIQGMIDSALESQRLSFQEVLEKTEERHSQNLQEIRNSLGKTLKIISQMSSSISTLMMTYASDSQLQHKEVVEIKEQLATVTKSLQTQMSVLQMDIRAALAVSAANQCITQDYLNVISENEKEIFRLLKSMASFTAKHT